MKPLTARQAEVLAFIRSFIAEHGMPPSLREIMRHFGFRSTRAPQCHLLVLEQKGAIARDGRARSIRLLDRAAPAPIRSAVLLSAGVETVAGNVYVNGRLVARFRNTTSAEGLARNLRLAFETAVTE